MGGNLGSMLDDSQHGRQIIFLERRLLVLGEPFWRQAIRGNARDRLSVDFDLGTLTIEGQLDGNVEGRPSPADQCASIPSYRFFPCL